MKLNGLRQVAVHADDMDESRAFYRDVLGLELIAEFDPPGLAFFNAGGVRLLLEKNAALTTLYFAVEDIDEAYAALLDKGVTFLHPPALVFPDESGQFGPAGEEEGMAFFNDPGGNTLALAARKAAGAH